MNNRSKTNHKEIKAEVALSHNSAYSRSLAAHPKRTDFFACLDETESVNALIENCLRPTFKQRVGILLSICKQLIKRVLRYSLGGKKNVKDTKKITKTTLSENACVSSISFRNKQQGWKSYRMEITFKN